MARPPWVAQIRNTKNTGDQILALRSLKNELIGHPVKKEAAVESGVLEAVVHLSTNRVAGRHDGKSHDHTFASESLTEEETVRLQGIHVIASIALGKIWAVPYIYMDIADQACRWPLFPGLSA